MYLSARATFKDRIVRVTVTDGIGQVFTEFIGAFNNANEGTSEGVLEYSGLPEGEYDASLSVTQLIGVNVLVIKFTLKGLARDTPANPEFKGKPFGNPAADTGAGIWKSINLHQQVFLLSLASNKIQEQQKTLDKLTLDANREITPLVTVLGWEVVWGPTVWKHDPNNESGPDHVWFVAKKLGPNNLKDTYAIAVSGSATIYNHLVNNAGVVQTVDFATWVSGYPIPTSSIAANGSYIAFGTAQGVHTLRSFPAPKGAKEAGKTLPVFLKGADGRRNGEFIFTGHSLGAVLSLTLGFGLLKADPAVFIETDTIHTFPVASPTAGNAHFVNAFTKSFPKTNGSGYQVWNTNIVNLKDVVPHGWCTDPKQTLNLLKIPTIYDNKRIPSIDQKISLAVDAANKSGIVYHPLPNTTFTGTVSEKPTSEAAFIKIVKEQHSQPYLIYFGIRLPNRILQIFGSTSAEARADEEDPFPEVFIGI